MKNSILTMSLAAVLSVLTAACESESYNDGDETMKLGYMKIVCNEEESRDIIIDEGQNCLEVRLESDYFSDESLQIRSYEWSDPDNPTVYTDDSGESGCDWISIEKTGKKGVYRISVLPNKTGLRRGVSLKFESRPDSRTCTYGALSVWQRDGLHKPEFSTTSYFEHPDYMYPDSEKVFTAERKRVSTGWFDDSEAVQYDNLEMQYWMHRLLDMDDTEIIYTSEDEVHFFSPEYDSVLCGIGKVDISAAHEDQNGLKAGMPLRQTRAVNPFVWWDASAPGYVALFDDNGFADTSINFNLYNLYQSVDIPNMKEYGLNDKVSSIALGYNGNNSNVCTVLTVWEDSDYNHGDIGRKKHRLHFLASGLTRMLQIPDLRKVICHGSSSNWNDRISSMSLHFGYVDASYINY